MSRLCGLPDQDGIDHGLGTEKGFIVVTGAGSSGEHEIPWGLDGFDHLITRTCPCGPIPEPVPCDCTAGTHTVLYRHRLVRD